MHLEYRGRAGSESISEPDDWVEIPDEELQARFAPTEAELQAQANSEALSALSSGDWQVIRELERKFLTGTELNKEREALRASIVKE